MKTQAKTVKMIHVNTGSRLEVIVESSGQAFMWDERYEGDDRCWWIGGATDAKNKIAIYKRMGFEVSK